MDAPASPANGNRPRRTVAIHPPLIAAHPVLALYAANVALIPVRDVFAPVIVAMLAACALWGLLTLLLRNGARAAAAASVFAFGFFWFAPFVDFAKASGFVVDATAYPFLGLGLWLSASGLVAWLAARNWNRMEQATKFLNFVAVAMVTLASLGIVRGHWVIRTELRDAIARVAPIKGEHSGPLPDVFLVVLDGYGRSDVLKERYGYDNSDLIQGLKERGFFVAEKARTNYVQTELSLAGTLNLEPVDRLITGPIDTPGGVRGVLDGLIDRSRFAASLKNLGYRYIAVTSGFPSLAFTSADLVYGSDAGSTLFLASLFEKTPIRQGSQTITSIFHARWSKLHAAFENLKGLGPRASTPRFVIAHVLAPHPPFVMAADGSFQKPGNRFGFYDGSHYMVKIGTPESYRSGYAAQAKAVGSLLLETVDALLDQKDPPIVVVLGDHGPKMGLDQESLEKTDIEEVAGILAAYHVPKGVAEELYPEITPVNAMRLLHEEISGESLPKLPDSTFYSTWEAPMSFVDVTKMLDDLEDER